MLGAAVNRADRDDHGIERVGLAAHDGLQIENDPGREHDGIDGDVRCGTVAALALYEQINGVRIGECQAFRVADDAGGLSGVGVQSQGEVGFGEALIEAVFEHHAGTGPDFLRRLGDEHQRARPLLLEGGHHAGRTDPRSHVNVVAAGVHDAVFNSEAILHPNLAGIRNAGLLRDRQGVDVGAEEYDGAGSVLQNADDAGAADLLGDLEAEFLQFLGKAGGGLHFQERELGVRVQVLVKSDEILGFAVELRIDLREAIFDPFRSSGRKCGLWPVSSRGRGPFLIAVRESSGTGDDESG